MSDAVWALVQHCWSHQPHDRPSASVVAGQLDDIVRREKTAPSEIPEALQCLQLEILHIIVPVDRRFTTQELDVAAGLEAAQVVEERQPLLPIRTAVAAAA